MHAAASSLLFRGVLPPQRRRSEQHGSSRGVTGSDFGSIRFSKRRRGAALLLPRPLPAGVGDAEEPLTERRTGGEKREIEEEATVANTVGLSVCLSVCLSVQRQRQQQQQLQEPLTKRTTGEEEGEEIPESIS